MPIDESDRCPVTGCAASIRARIGSEETEQIVVICEQGHITTLDTDDL